MVTEGDVMWYEARPWVYLLWGFWALSLGSVASLFGLLLTIAAVHIICQRASYRGWWPYNGTSHNR